MRSRGQPSRNSRREASGTLAAQRRNTATALYCCMRAAATATHQRLRLLSLRCAALLSALQDPAAQAYHKGKVNHLEDLVEVIKTAKYVIFMFYTLTGVIIQNAVVLSCRKKDNIHVADVYIGFLDLKHLSKSNSPRNSK